MKKIIKTKLTEACYYVSIEEENFNLLCSSPADINNYLDKNNLIAKKILADKIFETGPNSILLSDVLVQNYQVSNLCENPIFHMFYKQNLLSSVYKTSTNKKPIIIGDSKQIDSQLEYITRGNYGLLNDFEFSNLDLDEEQISNIIDYKLYFDLKNVFSNNDLLDLKYLIKDDKIEIRDNIFIKRIKINIFELSYKDETVIIDLNLQIGKKYELLKNLDYHKVPYEDFFVLHSTKMSSILMFHGKIYLLDTPANILDILNSLGIGLSDIEGVFSSNLHDDNFVGLSSLLLRDQKIKYYSSKVVRYSLMKKLGSLLRMPISSLSQYFEFVNLELDTWNKIENFEVKPFLSIDSVESNIFYFKALNEKNEYISYAHLSNIVSLKDMKEMLKENDDDFGLSKSFYLNSCKNFSNKVSLKKISYRNILSVEQDELIDDLSSKIILNQNSLKNIKNTQVSSFANIDVLIKSSNNYLKNKVEEFLSHFFKDIPKDNLEVLLECKIKNISPQSIILNENEAANFVYLILSGSVEKYKSDDEYSSYISSGYLLAYKNILINEKVNFTYKTKSFVNVLEIPKDIYLKFVQINRLENSLNELILKTKRLKEFSLFSSFLSAKTIITITSELSFKKYKHNVKINEIEEGLCLILKGEVSKFLYGEKIDTLKINNFFGERNILNFKKNNYEYRALGDLELYIIPKDVLKDFPVIHWRLFLQFQKSLMW